MAISDKSTAELEEAKQTINKLENRIVELESATRAAKTPVALPEPNQKKPSRPKVKNSVKISEQPFLDGIERCARKMWTERTGTDGTSNNFYLLKNWEMFRLSPNFLESRREPTDAMRIQPAKLPQD